MTCTPTPQHLAAALPQPDVGCLRQALRKMALDILLATSADAKVQNSKRYAQAFWADFPKLKNHDAKPGDALPCDCLPAEKMAFERPGLPAALKLVDPKTLPRRKLSRPEGRAMLVHALAHIEFSAINLAWDAVYRFEGMPFSFYADWLLVGDEEAYHFSLLRQRLVAMGFDYGDFPAHAGLWDMAWRTKDSLVARMALVPRCMEARGLDVTPGIQKKLRACGEDEGADILDIILRDEIGHVLIGDRWYRHACELEGLAPEETFKNLLKTYLGAPQRPPFHVEARRLAGFSEAEIQYLQSQSGGVGP